MNETRNFEAGGRQSFEIQIHIRADSVPEGDERFEVVISNARLRHASDGSDHPWETPTIIDGVSVGTIKTN